MFYLLVQNLIYFHKREKSGLFKIPRINQSYSQLFPTLDLVISEEGTARCLKNVNKYLQQQCPMMSIVGMKSQKKTSILIYGHAVFKEEVFKMCVCELCQTIPWPVKNWRSNSIIKILLFLPHPCLLLANEKRWKHWKR